ncbi:MAG: hypothetical protein GY694_07325, partial [Gammaproteobacteria bacterium]|nr:hypothetical protein [Gammaproteobacteria bacterium]
LTLDASGGGGGNVITTNPHGPGGGGGGGAIYIDATGASIDDSGGAPGTFSGGGNHGALDGGSGNNTAITDIPTPIACDYPDESAYNSSSTIHQLDGAGGGLTGLTIGSSVDFEASGLGTVMDTSGDDITDTGASDDEDGVVFSLVPGNNSSMKATVSYTNPTAGSVNLCGWLDINDNGSYETTEGICNSVGSSGSVELTWTGLSAVSAYTVYA